MTHTVRITVNRDNITVQPETLVMTMRDELQWAGTNAGRFSIEFDGDGPFASRVLSHGVATGRHVPRSKGHFKYTVVSEDNPGLRLDPIIVVDPPPTPGEGE